MNKKRFFVLGVVLCLSFAGLASENYSWQQPHAKVLKTGDLKWKPEPFQYAPGKSIRYIDYEKGSDDNDGTSKGSAWKHHPWDAQATGNAKACSGIHTYVFKRGVIYRGSLMTKGSGEPGNPIQLTSDPSWGKGEASIYGSELATGWTKASHPKMPDGDKVWKTDLPFSTRMVCAVYPDGKTVRLKLARTPNWNPDADPDDPYKDLWQWERKNVVGGWKLAKGEANGKKTLMGTDAKNLTGGKDYYDGALVYSEWGVVMGAPYATPVEKFDEKTKTIYFQGPWQGDSGLLHPGCRYWLEDKPHYLDEAGEYWFEKKGDGGTLYVRLPGDEDPNKVRIEASKWRTLVDSKGISHFEVSGLDFKFGNIFWNLSVREIFADVATAGVRVDGSGKDINIHNCDFEYMASGIIIKVAGKTSELDDIKITDNTISHTDHGAILVADSTVWAQKTRPGQLITTSILRNKLYDIGFRPYRPNGHHALEVRFPQTAEIAGNFLNRCGASGIFVFGGKASGAQYDAPLSRTYIHHNKVENALLIANDWGAIETWQGGPFYVYDNVVYNNVGPMHWSGNRWSAAYYMDGSFKNYLFNNIAIGKANSMKNKFKATICAFQNIHGYQNSIFNNTASRFRLGSNRQAAVAGRCKYLGNVFHDISEFVFKHGKSGVDPNAKDAGKEAEHFAYDLNSYGYNVFADIKGKFGPFEADGGDYADLKSFAEAMRKRQAQVGEVGVMAEDQPFTNRDQKDFRLKAMASSAKGKGVRMFVPFSLYATVGEWNFIPHKIDPTRIVDEHWFLIASMNNRETYHNTEAFPMKGVNITATDFVEGDLEDWATGSLKLNGKDQYLVLKNHEMKKVSENEPADRSGTQTVKPNKYFTVTAPKTVSTGEPFEYTIELSGIPNGRILAVDINWLKEGGFGGWNAFGGRKTVNGPGPYTFKSKVSDKPGLASYILTIYTSANGNWKNKEQSANVNIAKAKGSGAEAAATPFSPHVDKESFVFDVYFKTVPGAKGVIAEKNSKSGWGIEIDADGKAVFKAGSKSVRSTNKLNDGKWHYLLTEADRKNKTLTIYVDGKLDARAEGIGGDVSLQTKDDMYVGGTPKGRNLAGTIDFMRLSLGSLADSKTSIEEIYAWQFGGPFLSDFTGKTPNGIRKAGALDN